MMASGPRARPGLLDGLVFLAQMDTVCFQDFGRFHIVVHQEGHLVLPAQGLYLFPFRHQVFQAQMLFPELEQGHPGPEGFLHRFIKIPALETVPVSDQVQAQIKFLHDASLPAGFPVQIHEMVDGPVALAHRQTVLDTQGHIALAFSTASGSG